MNKTQTNKYKNGIAIYVMKNSYIYATYIFIYIDATYIFSQLN